jgi:pimeloyl-ACP methyl ester carboxylesterase
MARGTYSGLPNQRIKAANGVEYTYRQMGDGSVPLVLLQHFRGNLDNWDPALMETLASGRNVVAVDNVGVGGTSGATQNSVREMAHSATAFISAKGFEQVDLLGFSIGSFVAQEIALSRPEVVRRMVLASSAPEGAKGMHGWPPDVIGAVGKPETSAEEYLSVFFTSSNPSQQAGKDALGRMYSRQEDRDVQTTWDTRVHQYDAVCAWGIPKHAAREGKRPQYPSLHRQRGRRPHDPSALFAPVSRTNPAIHHQDLSGLGARVPLSASRRIRSRCR